MLLNLTPPANTEKQARIQKKQIKRELLYLFAVRHAHGVSNDNESIASAIGVSVEKVEKMKRNRLWVEAWDFHCGSTPTPEIDTTTGDFLAAYHAWKGMMGLPYNEHWHYDPPNLFAKDSYPDNIIGIEYLHWRNQLWRYGRNALIWGGEIMLVFAFLGV